MILTTLAAAALLCAEAKPEGLTVSTWVREDIFKGFLANDTAGFEPGMDKLEAILAADPQAADAIAWRAGGYVYRAVRAFEAGDRAQFDTLYGRAKAEFVRARGAATAQTVGAVLAVSGGTFAVLGDRLPAELRREAWGFVREDYGALRGTQKAFFDKLPPHMRGEVLAGLAQAEQRLNGQPGAALAELIQALPNSVYASRAKRWQQSPDVAAKTSLTCQTCHEAGRLSAVLDGRKKR